MLSPATVARIEANKRAALVRKQQRQQALQAAKPGNPPQNVKSHLGHSNHLVPWSEFTPLGTSASALTSLDTSATSGAIAFVKSAATSATQSALSATTSDAFSHLDDLFDDQALGDLVDNFERPPAEAAAPEPPTRASDPSSRESGAFAALDACFDEAALGALVDGFEKGAAKDVTTNQATRGSGGQPDGGPGAASATFPPVPPAHACAPTCPYCAFPLTKAAAASRPMASRQARHGAAAGFSSGPSSGFSSSCSAAAGGSVSWQCLNGVSGGQCGAYRRRAAWPHFLDVELVRVGGGGGSMFKVTLTQGEPRSRTTPSQMKCALLRQRVIHLSILAFWLESGVTKKDSRTKIMLPSAVCSA